MTLIPTMRYASPCGELLLASHAGRLCLCDWAVRGPQPLPLRRLLSQFRAECIEVTGPAGEVGPLGGEDCDSASLVVLAEARRQLDRYFGGRLAAFSVPLLHVGTAFQRRVWEALLAIPYGSTVSYGNLAVRLGLPKAVRAVAGAVGANGLSLFVPCHRVVGSGGALTGYAGGIEAKRILLDLETRNVA